MEILKYTEEHNDFRKRLIDFFEKEVTPHAAQWEKDHIVPKSVWRKMGEAGFLCYCLPKEYGGIGGDFLYSIIVAEEIAKTGQAGLMASLHSDIVVPYISSYGTEEIKKKYLSKCATGEIITSVAMTEPDVGSDIAAMATTAVEEGDEVVLNGSKTFISNGINTGLVVVAARNPEIENPYAGISLYLVEDGTPGFTRGKHLEKMGMHSQDTAELFFTNCRIPKTNILGEKGAGFTMLMAKLQQERLVCSIGAVAAAQVVVDDVIEKLKETKYTTGRSMTQTQSVQFSLVELVTDIKIGQTFVEKLVADHMEGLDVLTETVMSKYWTTDMLNRTISKCIDYFGDDGLTEDNPIVQGFRDVRIMTIFAGTNEIMKMVAAGNLGL